MPVGEGKVLDHMTRPFVFIGGMPRSGTTLLVDLLRRHSQIGIGHNEGQLFRFIEPDRPLSDLNEFDRVLDSLLAHRLVEKWGLRREQVLEEANRYEKSWRSLYALPLELYARNQGKRYGGEKTPLLEFYFPHLDRWFRETGYVFIHVIRDPLDNFVSRRYLNPRKRLGALESSKLWVKSTSLALKRTKELPKNYLLVRYEDLTRDSEATLTSICRALDIFPELDAMVKRRDDSRNANSSYDERIITAEYHGIVRTADDLDRGTLVSNEQRLIVQEVCGPLAGVMGYDRPIVSDDSPEANRAIMNEVLARLCTKTRQNIRTR